jgi:seryl-tRNA synthetase
MDQITIAEVWQEYLKISRQYHEITVEVAGALTATTNKMKAIEEGLEGARQAGKELAQLKQEIVDLTSKIDNLTNNIQDCPGLAMVRQESMTEKTVTPWWYEEKNVLIGLLFVLVLLLLGFRLSGKNFHIEAPGQDRPAQEQKADTP